MLAAVTPRSAARAKSGVTMISGRTKEALELTLPMPCSVRSSRSTCWAAAFSATASSLRSTSCIFTPVSGGPTLKRAPGISASRVRICDSIAAIDALRSLRWLVVSVNVALRASAEAPGAKASPLEPPPTDENTCWTSGTVMAASRVRSASARVSASVLPGGSSRLICVCARSDAGTNPVGSSGTSETEPIKNAAAPKAVASRWFRHHLTLRM